MRTKKITNYKTTILAICVLSLATLSGCATQGNKDPLEGLNRGVYKFNDVTDRAIIKPVAIAYKTITPSPIRTGFNNFFTNLGSLTTVLNDILQLKLADAFTDAGRFVINSTFGIAGFIDVAGKDNIRYHKEDFGQTLGFWGVGNGPYLVLPLLGPSSFRDTTGLVFDIVTSDPITYPHNIGQVRLSNQLRAAQFLDKRTELLTASDLVDEASLDPYAFTRDAYLQKRASLVQDGQASEELNKDDYEDIDAEIAIDPANADTPAK
ncbi:MAG: VacJ family lipoprotein [Methylotenera sp.]|uniref:MlaA family lipoprotein n=1 Tax=Methylotenera sp. TaxID=2051956 RepID=UPI002489DF29|nr:VacJ family lipoprotein [Methylotenera sp.]MDI1310043.1 VacJ family lipoprotein [Methylotenera sp.]